MTGLAALAGRSPPPPDPPDDLDHPCVIAALLVLTAIWVWFVVAKASGCI